MNRPDVKISEPSARLRSLALACARVPLALALLPSCARMVVEQCTKCGVKGCQELFGQTSEWRDVIPNDELCDSCRGDVEWRKDNVLVPLSDQVVKAAHFGEREILDRLVDQGAPLSGALSGVENAKLGCHLRLTAVAAVCLEFRDVTSYQEILDKLLCWDADSHTAVVCETHGGDHSELPIGCIHGQTPLQLASKFEDPWFANRIRKRHFRGRERRGTPVKERAVNAGITLPPTPPGVRSAIEHGTPATQAQAKRQLQRHQKSCQQRVVRAEERGEGKSGHDGREWHEEKSARHLALHAATQANHRKRKQQQQPCKLGLS